MLDVGCGKGGDFNKWKFAGTRNYFGVDISLKALQDAAQRKIDSNPHMTKNLRVSVRYSFKRTLLYHPNTFTSSYLKMSTSI